MSQVKAKSGERAGTSIGEIFNKYSIYFILIMLVVILSVLSPAFLKPMNLINIRRVAYDLNSQCCCSGNGHGADSHAAPAASCCSGSGHGTSAPAAGAGNIDINAVTELIVAELKKVL